MTLTTRVHVSFELDTYLHLKRIAQGRNIPISRVVRTMVEDRLRLTEQSLLREYVSSTLSKTLALTADHLSQSDLASLLEKIGIAQALSDGLPAADAHTSDTRKQE